jgi:ATP-dependent Clp protease, protease subunit
MRSQSHHAPEPLEADGPVARRRRIPFYDDELAEPAYERFEDHLKAGRLAARRYYLDEAISTESARTFRAWTDAMLGRSADPITVIINSPGGDVVAGLDIVSQIRSLQRAGVEVRGHVVGDAASMGAVVLAACSVRSMGSLGRLLWHGIVSLSFGDATDMKSQQKELDRMTATISAILTATARPGTRFANRAWVRRTMSEKRPVWIYPEEALASGLVDEVVE